MSWLFNLPFERPCQKEPHSTSRTLLPELHSSRDAPYSYLLAGSFGTAEQFGSNLVGGMDQSFLKRAPKWAVKKDQIPQASMQF